MTISHQRRLKRLEERADGGSTSYPAVVVLNEGETAPEGFDGIAITLEFVDPAGRVTDVADQP